MLYLQNMVHHLCSFDIIKCLHTDFKLKLVFDKRNQTFINYTVGVCQGDNMAGLQFLFLMQAMDKSYQKQYKLPEAAFQTHCHSGKCKLLWQPSPAMTKGLYFNFSKSMFADDTAYLLLSPNWHPNSVSFNLQTYAMLWTPYACQRAQWRWQSQDAIKNGSCRSNVHPCMPHDPSRNGCCHSWHYIWWQQPL